MKDRWTESNVGGLWQWSATRVGGDGATIRARTLDELRGYESAADGRNVFDDFAEKEQRELELSHEMVAAEGMGDPECYYPDELDLDNDDSAGDCEAERCEPEPCWARSARRIAHVRGHLR